MIAVHEFKFVFVEIPRTASTAMREVLLRDFGGEDLPGEEVYCKSLKHQVRLPDSCRDYMVVGGVRNPFTRMLSHYLLKRRQNPRWLDPYRVYLRKLDRECDVKFWLDIAGIESLDFAIRHEGLPHSFQEVVKILTGRSVELPFAGQKTSGHNVKYNPITARLVMDKSGHDFETYGYALDSWKTLNDSIT